MKINSDNVIDSFVMKPDISTFFTGNRDTDELKFEELVVKYQDTLQRVVASYEVKPQLAQELYQEILLAIWQALPGFRGDSSPLTFIYRIAHNRAVTHVIRNSRQPAEVELDLSLESESVSPQKFTELEQRQNQLFSAIRKLPVMQRQTLSLALEGLSYQEIADITGITVNNIGVRLNRTRAALRKLLEGDQ